MYIFNTNKVNNRDNYMFFSDLFIINKVNNIHNYVYFYY